MAGVRSQTEQTVPDRKDNVTTKQGDLEPGRPTLSEQSGAAHDSHKGHMLSQTPSTGLGHRHP